MSNSEFEQHAILYAMLGAINEAVLHGRTRYELFENVCDIAMLGDKFLAAAIGIHDAGKSSVEFIAAAGKGSDRMRNIRVSIGGAAAQEPSLAGTAIRTLVPCISNDFQAGDCARYRHDAAFQKGIAAAAAIPLLKEGQAIGVLLFYSGQKNSFDADAVELLQRMAGNISFGLDNFAREEERERDERALRESAGKYEDLLQGIADAYYEVDLQGKQLVVNSAFSRTLGYACEEAAGKSMRDFQTPEMADALEKAFSEVHRTGVAKPSHGWEYLHKNGSVVKVEGSISPMRDADGTAIGVRGVFRDVTQRSKNEEALRASEELYRTILETMEDGYYETDLEGRHLRSNRALYRMSGHTAEELIAGGLRTRQTPEMAKISNRIFYQAYQTGMPMQGQQWQFFNKNGQVVSVEGSIHLVRDASGTITGFRGIMRDITQRKREERLLTLEHRIALELAEASTVRKGVQMVIRHVCQAEQWESGGYWVRGTKPGTFRLDAGWAGSAAVGAFYNERIEALEDEANSCLTEAWETGNPCWITDASKDPRLAMNFDARRVFADKPLAIFYVPVAASGQTVAILSFSNHAIVEPDERLLKTVSVIASQLGQFLRRRHAERVLRESEERFRALTNLSSDWYWEQDAEFRFTRMESRHASKDEIKSLLLGRRAWDSGFDIQNEGGWNAFRETIASHAPFRDIVMHRTLQNGEPYYISLSGEPVSDRKGTVAGYRGVSREITDQKIAEERIQYLATHDGLTGLPNRALFSHLLNDAISTALRYHSNFAVLFIDLDRFKFINDTLGHEAGDTLLKEVTTRFKQALRASDVIARMGGDEFVVLMREMNDPNQAAIVARKLLAATIQPVVLSEQECRVTASVGIAMYPMDGEGEQALMKNADIAMYLAKEEGKNSFRFYSQRHRKPVGRTSDAGSELAPRN